MDPSHYSESRYPASPYSRSFHPHTVDFDPESHQLFHQYPHALASHHYSPGMLPTQYTAAYDTAGVFPTRDDFPWHLKEHGSLVYDGAGLPIQPQGTCPSYADKAIQTTQSDPTSKRNNGRERLRTHRRPAPRHPVHQETYQSTRHHAEFVGSKDIEFIVDGEEGIRLSDALDGKWAGFEGWDDRSLFEGGRLQIIIRLHFPGCLPWNSKIPTADFTAKRRQITRMKLAAEVAKCMKRFIARETLNGHGHGHLQCGWGSVSLENVFLTRMVHGSTASWQPQFSMERPSAALQAASSSSSSPDPLA